MELYTTTPALCLMLHSPEPWRSLKSITIKRADFPPFRTTWHIFRDCSRTQKVLEDAGFVQRRQDVLPSQAAWMKLLMGWMEQTASSCHKTLHKPGLATSPLLKSAPASRLVVFCYHKCWPPNCCNQVPVTSRHQTVSLHSPDFSSFTAGPSAVRAVWHEDCLNKYMGSFQR